MQAVIGFKATFFLLDGAPQSLHKDVVKPSAFAMHGHAYAIAFQQSCDSVAAKLTALFGVEDGSRPQGVMASETIATQN